MIEDKDINNLMQGIENDEKAEEMSRKWALSTIIFLVSIAALRMVYFLVLCFAIYNISNLFFQINIMNAFCVAFIFKTILNKFSRKSDEVLQAQMDLIRNIIFGKPVVTYNKVNNPFPRIHKY